MSAFGLPAFVLPNIPFGKVIQTVGSTATTPVSSTTSASYIESGLTATITPISALNKVLVFISQNGTQKVGNTAITMRVIRNGASPRIIVAQGGYTATAAENNIGTIAANYIDSPASTTPQTYTVQFLSTYGVATAWVQYNNDVSSMVLMEVTP